MELNYPIRQQQKDRISLKSDLFTPLMATDLIA